MVSSFIRRTGVELRIGLGITLCLVAAHFHPSIQALSACTAVVMCGQTDSENSWRASLSRMHGVLLGSGVGTFLLLVLPNFPSLWSKPLYPLLSGIGAICTLLLCRATGLSDVGGRVSCISFILTLMMGDSMGYYGLARLFGTFVGASIATLLTLLCDLYRRMVCKNTAKQIIRRR